MEKKNTVLLTIIAIATLLIAVVGATFAFFAANVTANQGLNINANLGSASAMFLANGSDITIDVLANKMQSSSTGANGVLAGEGATNTTNLVVTYGAAAANQESFCTYDVVFYWTDGGSKYLYDTTTPTQDPSKPSYQRPMQDGTTLKNWFDFNDGASMEFSIAATGEVGGTSSSTAKGKTTVPPFVETNIGYDGYCGNTNYTNHETCIAKTETWNQGFCTRVETCSGTSSNGACLGLTQSQCATAGGQWNDGTYMTLVRGAKIYSDATYTNPGDGTTATWTVTVKFYNLPLNQNQLAGQTYVGRLEVANVVC